MKLDKMRIDALLFQKGLAESREQAKRLIMAGEVYLAGQRVDRASALVEETADLTVREREKYVSRGGLKLEKAIDEFSISLEGKVCMDIGSSTGGFTDCMLQNGAKRVYAVDVGYGQLAWKLRIDDRVTSLERTNIRYLDNSLIDEPVEFITIDVAFISLRLVFPKVKELLVDDGACVALIKPQFEAGREQVGKKGVVRDKDVHLSVVENVVGYALENGLHPHMLSYSPIKGPEGNIEYLIYLGKQGKAPINIKEIVEKSHSELT